MRGGEEREEALLVKGTKSQKGIISSQLCRNHNVLTHFPKDPNCEDCKMTKNARARYEVKLGSAWIGLAPWTKICDLITADH